MNRYKNPFCLDPKETSCPRLEKLGVKFNTQTGRLEISSKATPEQPTVDTPEPPEPPVNTRLPPDIHKLDRINKYRGKNEILNLGKGIMNYYKSRAPTYRHKIPAEIGQMATAIYKPEEFVRDNEDWKIAFDDPEELALNVLNNEKEKLVRINFHGYGYEHQFQNVIDIFLGRDRRIQQSEEFLKTDGVIKAILRVIENDENYRVMFVGHSYGGYKARYFAALYDKLSVGLNSHHMPWSKFPKGGQHQVHTVISDPLDFKHLFGNVVDNESHYYYPPNEQNISGEWVDGHYIHSMDTTTARNEFIASYHEHIGALGTLFLGFGAGQAIYDMKKGIDPTEDIALTTAGFDPAGLILDPDYQYSDKSPPQFGIDYAVYHGIQPLKQTILNKTPWGQQRKQEDALMNLDKNVMPNYLDIGGGVYYSTSTGQYVDYDLQKITEPKQQYRAIYWAKKNNLGPPVFTTQFVQEQQQTEVPESTLSQRQYMTEGGKNYYSDNGLVWIPTGN